MKERYTIPKTFPANLKKARESMNMSRPELTNYLNLEKKHLVEKTENGRANTVTAMEAEILRTFVEKAGFKAASFPKKGKGIKARSVTPVKKSKKKMTKESSVKQKIQKHLNQVSKLLEKIS